MVIGIPRFLPRNGDSSDNTVHQVLPAVPSLPRTALGITSILSSNPFPLHVARTGTMIRSVPFRKGGAAIRAFFGGLTFLKGLRLLWLLVVLWFEGVRHSFVSSCDWGDRKLGIHSVRESGSFFLWRSLDAIHSV